VGGFAGKQRRRQAARGVVGNLVKRGIVSAEEGASMRRHLKATGTLGILKDYVKAKKTSTGKTRYVVVDEFKKQPKAGKKKAARPGGRRPRK
jgi:hypothetical protein